MKHMVLPTYMGSRRTLKGNLRDQIELDCRGVKLGQWHSPLDTRVHQDTKVIAQEGTSNTELPRRGDDKELAEAEEDSRDDGGVLGG